MATIPSRLKRRGQDPPHGTRMTYEAFSSLPEQAGLQLIDGFVVREPSPLYGHQACVSFLVQEMGHHVRLNRLGIVLVAPFDVILTGVPENQVLQPDLLFVSAPRRSIVTARGLTSAPDLAVEVLSPSTKAYDLGRKRMLYYEHGCRELWIIDTKERKLHRQVRDAAAWEIVTLGDGDRLSTPVVEGFAFNLRDMFKESSMSAANRL